MKPSCLMEVSEVAKREDVYFLALIQPCRVGKITLTNYPFQEPLLIAHRITKQQSLTFK